MNGQRDLFDMAVLKQCSSSAQAVPKQCNRKANLLCWRLSVIGLTSWFAESKKSSPTGFLSFTFFFHFIHPVAEMKKLFCLGFLAQLSFSWRGRRWRWDVCRRCCRRYVGVVVGIAVCVAVGAVVGTDYSIAVGVAKVIKVIRVIVLVAVVVTFKLAIFGVFSSASWWRCRRCSYHRCCCCWGQRFSRHCHFDVCVDNASFQLSLGFKYVDVETQPKSWLLVFLKLFDFEKKQWEGHSPQNRLNSTQVNLSRWGNLKWFC